MTLYPSLTSWYVESMVMGCSGRVMNAIIELVYAVVIIIVKIQYVPINE